MEVLTMIKYSEAEPLDVIPSPARSDYDVIAISYAIKMATAKLIAFAASIRLYGDIGSLSEEILDLLALELQTQYYSESLDIDTKRALVKNTLLWYMNAGTVQTLKEFAEIVFGESEITEWFDYDGEAYYFKIETGADISYETLAYVASVIENIKNARSHLEEVIYLRPLDNANVYAATIVKQDAAQRLTNDYELSGELAIGINMLIAACGEIYGIIEGNSGRDAEEELGTIGTYAATIVKQDMYYTLEGVN